MNIFFSREINFYSFLQFVANNIYTIIDKELKHRNGNDYHKNIINCNLTNGT